MSDLTYTLHYLGCSTLSKGTTGLGSIQKPLKEHYFNFHKKVTKSPAEVYMQITYEGLDILTSNGSGSGTYLKNTHYEFNMINYMEAVQFTINKNNTRKTQFAFMPLDEKRIVRSPDKLFSTLEKKNNYLLKISHQPIVVCLLRRQAGLKALDCHVFLSLSTTDATKIVESFNFMQQKSMQKEYIGDFGAASQNPDPKDPRTNEMNYHSLPRSPENQAVGSNAMASGQYPPSHPNEGYQLRDEYFRHQVHDDWALDRNDRFPDVRSQHPYGQPQPYNQQPPFPGSPHQNRHVQLSRGHSYYERPVANQEGQSNYPHNQENRQRFPSKYGRPMSENIRGYGQYPNYDEQQRQAGELHPMAQKTNASEPYSPKMPHSQQYQQNSFTSQPLNHSGPMYSLSNLESRQQFDRNDTGQSFEAARNKPVAKVPPHKIAGVKVLPTAFELPKRPISPKPSHQEYDNSAKLSSNGTNWDKADVQYRHSSHDNRTANNRYSNVYAFDSKSDEGSRNYLRTSLSASEPRPMSMATANDYYKSQIPTMSQHDIYRQYQTNNYPNQLNPNYNPAVGDRQYKPDMSVEQDRRSQANEDAMRRQEYSHNYKQYAASNPHLNIGSKEAEIASMFQNIEIDRQHIQSNYNRHDNMNFEKSLGYYP
ncbi:uncharacterized protein LOC106870350 isoform X2 [Octopus bimaculoides]|uniref:PID domain-containing protein n=2 Tax=Octopus bimaculoides TaxID=37653 RepID=A0A0L8HJB8_OCTBM|nr:uncharacterized protein LOC106870350 isoform X2 [Octopus bimaculoides]XP_014771870.1 uncharacterized protein LOC106870350 isoform X2 [Octopus bimaculoides]XP_052832914.1 uncharacterized protein LOC106870350 isoform X2 [Octopus bimaculoides]|eukprot:XP_014771868.1 PREDICTED: uncharacterized protein LOC106870350 [Octopus bimaculoides]